MIRGDNRFRAIPVIALTTSEVDKDIMESYCRNANAFITKPIEFEDFVAVMRTIGDF